MKSRGRPLSVCVTVWRQQDVRVQLLKDGDHRLSSPGQLALMGDTLAELIKTASRIAS